jgi:hypothetical protein
MYVKWKLVLVHLEIVLVVVQGARFESNVS